MSSLSDKWNDVVNRIGSPKLGIPDEETSEDVMERYRVEQQSRVNDMRVFVGTEAYKALIEKLNESIRSNRPRPELGTDVAACYTFKQEGLREALDIIQKMVRLAEEQNRT